jgi:hypothetical protein
LSGVAWIGEKILNTFVGGIFERMVKWVQQRRIRENPITHEPGGRVIFTDEKLEFHPRSVETLIISRYNELIKNVNRLSRVKECDSGIRRAGFELASLERSRAQSCALRSQFHSYSRREE